MIPFENDPELNGKYLGEISADFVKICDHLKDASYEIRKRGFSQHPIFPICKEKQSIGQLFIESHQLENTWNYYISYMEEFVERKLLDNKDAFINSYKNPDEFCCLFVIDKSFISFVYIPYPEDGFSISES